MVVCCVPGCSSTNAESDLKFFTAIRPDTAGSDEVKHHRLALANFILAMMTKSQRHVDLSRPISSTLCICEKHFNPEDIFMNSSSLKRLKTGAMPCRNLPPDMPALIPMKDLSLMYNSRTLRCGDLHHSCHIPRCPYEVYKAVRETGVHYKYSSFKMKNPKFMKTNDPDRVWQTAVYKFLMDLTNQKLADSYHRDCVLVCERHFASADVSYIQGSKNLKKKLRVGAMPSLHIPDSESCMTMGSSKLLPPPLDEEPVIQHKTFASFSASVSRIAHKTWRISRKNSVIQCVKPSSDCCDQNEIILEIDKFFNIGMVYYGWCLPKDHFATTFDVRRHGLVKYLDYLEALTPCEGIKMTEDLNNPEVIDHYYTKSSKPFEYKPMVSKFLLRRSIECDVLLPAPSFGSCKACTVVNDSFKKEESIVQSQDDWSSILLEPNVGDSSFCARLKKELLKKSNKLMESVKIVQNQMNLLSRGQNQPGCKVVLLKEQTEKRKTKRSNLSKPHQETQDSEKLLHVKLITKDEYMQPILKFAKQQNLPETFSTFWQFQVGVLWKGMDNKLVANGVKYPEEILDIFADLYMKSRPAYTLLRDFKLLKMPKHESIKRHSVNRRKKVLEMKDNILMRGGTVSDASVPTTSPAINEQSQEVHIANAPIEQEARLTRCTDNAATLSVPIPDSPVVGNVPVMSNQQVDNTPPSVPGLRSSNSLSDGNTISMHLSDKFGQPQSENNQRVENTPPSVPDLRSPNSLSAENSVVMTVSDEFDLPQSGNECRIVVKPHHSTNGSETFVFSLTDDKSVKEDDKRFTFFGEKRKLPNDDSDTTAVKMSKMNEDAHTCEPPQQNADENITTPDIVIEVSVDSI